MHSTHRLSGASRARRPGGFLFGLVLVLMVLAVGAPPALAQNGETGRTGDFCLATVSDASSCSANDVTIETFAVVEVIESCIEGVPFEAVVQFDALVQGAQPARYGIGLFINLEGESALTGDNCLHDFLAPFSSDEADWQTNADGAFIAPFPNLNDSQCGDIPSGSNQVLKSLQEVRIVCADNTGDGFVDISACSSWENNANAECGGLEDAIAGTPSKCGCTEVATGLALPASVTVVKNTTEGDDTFNFITDLPGGNFSITTDGGTGQQGPLAVDPGDYSIEEDVPDGWVLVSASCGEAGDPANLSLGPGDEVTCTFLNAPEEGDAAIRIAKTALDGDGTFEFQTDPSFGTFSLTTSGGTAQTAFIPVAPGVYEITEIIPEGWDLTGATCDNGHEFDGDDTVVVTLEADDEVTCTFTNQKLLGTINVAKATDPGGSDQSFSIAVSGPDFVGSFSLADGEDDSTGAIAVGTYTVSETVPPGWALEEIDCGDKGGVDDGSTEFQFDLEEDDEVTCTFTNRQLAGTIIVQKQTDPGDSEQAFDITVSGAQFEDTFSLSDGEDANTGPIPTGAYVVSEDIPPGWSLDDIDCDAEGFVFDGEVGEFDLNDGDTVTCTFSNSQPPGSLTVEKTCSGIEAGTTFDFTASGDGLEDFSLECGGTVTFDDLEPGDGRSVVEAVPEGVVLTASCDDGSPTTNIDIEAGEAVTCTFNNSVPLAPPEVIPTTSRIGLMALALLLMGLAGLAVRRRRMGRHF